MEDRPADTLTIGPNQYTPIYCDNTAKLAAEGKLVYVKQTHNVYQPFALEEIRSCVALNNQNPVTRQPNLSETPMFGPINFKEIEKKRLEKERRAAARKAEQLLIHYLVEKNRNVFIRRWNVTEHGWDHIINFVIRSKLGHGPLLPIEAEVAAKFGMEAWNGTPVDQINCPLSMSGGLRQVIKIIRGCFEHAHVLLKKEQRDEAKRAEARRIAREKREKKDRRAAVQAAMKHKKKVERSKVKLDTLVKRFLTKAGVEECNKLLGSAATANAIETAVREWQQTQ
jgi:hypothetical protein